MIWKKYGCAVALAFAAGPANAAEPPIILLDGFHDLNYAKTTCEWFLSENTDSLGAAECRSFPDLHDLGRALENKMIIALAVETQCQGVRVLRDIHPSEPDDATVVQGNMALKDKNPHWGLHLDVEPGMKLFAWTLLAHNAGSDSPVEAHQRRRNSQTGRAGNLYRCQGTRAVVRPAPCESRMHPRCLP